jgi:hypothetical protein
MAKHPRVITKLMGRVFINYIRFWVFIVISYILIAVTCIASGANRIVYEHYIGIENFNVS